MTFTINDNSTWLETVGDSAGSLLGTSGNFVVTINYGDFLEERILCSSFQPGTTTINVVTRGYDGTGHNGGPGVQHIAGWPVVHTISTDVPYQANLGVTNAAAAQSTANAAQTTAYNVQVASTTGNISGTTPSTATPLKVVGWTAVVRTANQTTTGAGVAIPYNFPNALMSVVGTYSNEVSGTTPAGSRCTIYTNAATNSFRVFVYNAAGSKVADGGDYKFSFIAVGY